MRFAPVDLRPHESVTLDQITVFSSQDAESFPSEWKATATNVSSKVERSLAIPAQRLEVDLHDMLRSILGIDENVEQDESADD